MNLRKVLMKERWNLEANASNKNWGMTVVTFS